MQVAGWQTGGIPPENVFLNDWCDVEPQEKDLPSRVFPIGMGKEEASRQWIDGQSLGQDRVQARDLLEEGNSNSGQREVCWGWI